MQRIKKILDAGIESIETNDAEVGHKTKGYKRFTRMLNNDIRKLIASVGGEALQIHSGYYYASGFFKYNGQTWYFSFSDFRHFPGANILIRTAKDYFDYSGGRNQYIRLGEHSRQDLAVILHNENR